MEAHRRAEPERVLPAWEPAPIPTWDESEALSKKAGELAQNAASAYSLAWRTLGEALGIAVSGLVLGLFGGAIGAVGWALLAALAVGAAVGATNKPFWLAALSAPLGALLGAALGLGLWLAAGRLPLLGVLPAAALAVLAALLGGRPRSGPFLWWERLRPVFGALGGLAFGLAGGAAGWLLRQGVELLLSQAIRMLG